MVPSSISNFCLCLVALLVVVSSAFAPAGGSSCSHQSGLVSTFLSSIQQSSHEENFGRRNFMQQILAASATTAMFPTTNANAGLLDDFGSDPNKIVVKVEKKVEEEIVPRIKKSVEIEPTLKGSYYYPTAKKRYLPRITKVTSAIDVVPQQIANGQWEEVEEFRKTADNAILPLQLYVSSLDGQGLSMNNSYAKEMKKNAATFEAQYKLFEKAIKKKDQDAALSALQQMAVAVVNYRQAGRLTDDMGNIPDIQEIRRSTMRRPTQSSFVLTQ